MTQVGLTPGGQTKYGYFMRPVGAYLDILNARNVTLAEIEHGFIWHCYKEGQPLQPITGVFSFEEIPGLIESVKQTKLNIARTREAERRNRRAGFGRFKRHDDDDDMPATPHPLLPYSYEETFRSIGARLEDQRAYAPMLAERPASLLVVYSLPLPNYIRLDVTRMEVYSGMHEVEYSRQELQEIVENVRARRGIRYYQ